MLDDLSIVAFLKTQDILVFYWQLRAHPGEVGILLGCTELHLGGCRPFRGDPGVDLLPGAVGVEAMESDQLLLVGVHVHFFN